MIYLFIAFFLVICVIRFDDVKANNDNNVFIYNFTLIIFIGLATFRRDLGGDTWAYMEYYDLCPTLFDSKDNITFFITYSLLDGYMPLWASLNIIAKTISSEFYILQFFQAFIVNVLLFYIFKKYSKTKYLCILIYFIYSYWYMNAEIMREAIAVAIGSFSIINFYKKKYRRYFIQLILSFLFHPSAIFLLVLLLIKPRRFDIKNFIKYSILSIILFVLSDIILLKIISQLGSSVPLFDRISVYLNRGATIFGYLYSYIHYFIVPGIGALIINKRKFIKVSSPLYPILNIYFLIASIIIPMIGLNRLFNYFMPFAIIFFALLLKKVSRYHTTNFQILGTSLIAIVVFTNCYLYYNMVYQNTIGYRRYDFYLPYTHIGDKEDVSYRRDIWVSTLQNVEALDRSSN